MRRPPLANRLRDLAWFVAVAGVIAGYVTAILTVVRVVPVWAACTFGAAALACWRLSRDDDLRRASLFAFGAGVGAAVIRVLIEVGPW